MPQPSQAIGRLRDDDVVASLQMAAPDWAPGRYLPGGGTDVHLGSDSPDLSRMVVEHEVAHLELNMLTAYGTVLRLVGLASRSEDRTPESYERLAGLVNLCRTTHEVFATTMGVWKTADDFDRALVGYPNYLAYLTTGRLLSWGLLDGSVSACIAMACACWAAMQTPFGPLLRERGIERFCSDDLPPQLRPDLRLDALLEAGIDVGSLDLVVPESWTNCVLREASPEVDDFNAEYRRVASAYYAAFAEVLEAAEMPTLGYDGHLDDPDLRAWAKTLEGPREPVRTRAGKDGLDRFWRLSLSDAERIVLHAEPHLVAVHLADLPQLGDSKFVGLEDLAQGLDEDKGLLVVVRPLKTLLKQYKMTPESAYLLSAAAVDGIVTGVRAEFFTPGGAQTYLAVLSSTSQLEQLAAMPTRLGVLTSASDSCTYFPNWASYWAPALQEHTYIVKLADSSRRLWVESMDELDIYPDVSVIKLDSPRTAGFCAAGLNFSAEPDPTDPPYLAFGSQETIENLALAIAAIAGSKVVLGTRFPHPEEKFVAIVRRLFNEEPWFDTRSADDLPDLRELADAWIAHSG